MAEKWVCDKVALCGVIDPNNEPDWRCEEHLATLLHRYRYYDLAGGEFVIPDQDQVCCFAEPYPEVVFTMGDPSTVKIPCDCGRTVSAQLPEEYVTLDLPGTKSLVIPAAPEGIYTWPGRKDDG